MHPRTEQSLRDVIAACLEIEAFIAGISLEGYLSNRRLKLAIERLFIIVGEALRRAEQNDQDVTATIPHLRNILSMRHRIVHEYDTFDESVVYSAAAFYTYQLRLFVQGIVGNRS